MTQPSNSPPSPAEWSWVDTFDRTFVGADYDVLAQSSGGVRISNGTLLLAPALSADVNVNLDQGKNSITLKAARWNSANVSVQWDYEQRGAELDGLAWNPKAGVEIITPTKTLRWDGQKLTWGDSILISLFFLPIDDNVSLRHRLTIDRAAGRIQLVRANVGLIDIPIPADLDTAAGAQVALWCTSAASTMIGGARRRYELRFDNLAVRSGDGTADLSTGQVGSSGSVRLGGEWRFGAAPDDAVGADGDVWATPDGGIYQRIAGVYTLQMTLIGTKGDKGDTGEAGAVGAQGPQGPAGNPVALRNPILVGITPTDGHVLEIKAGEGGLEGVQLLGVDGPLVAVEISTDSGASWLAAQYPHTLAAGEWLRLTRTDQDSHLSVLRAYVPVKQGAGGSSGGLLLGRDADGYLTADGLGRDSDGYLTTNQPLGTDADGYFTGG